MIGLPFRSSHQPGFASSLILRGALLTVLILVTFAASSYYLIVRPTVTGLADAQMRLVSQQIDARVSQLLQSVETTLRSSRGWGMNGDLDHNQVLRFNEFFFPIIANHPEISSVNFAHESGREILLLKNPDGTWVNRLSNPDQWGKQTYWLHWSSTRKLESVEMRVLDYDTRKRPWNKGAMALPSDNSIYWTEPYIFFTTKDPGITAAMRWTGQDGSHYVIGHDVRLIELSTFTTGLTIGEAGRATLLQGDGRLLAPPHDARFSNTEAIKASVLKTPVELGLGDIDEGVKAWRAEGQPDNALGNFIFGGTLCFSLFHPISVGEQKFWLGVFAPEEDFLPGYRDKFLMLAVFALLALLAGVLASFRIVRQFGRPLALLADESARIGRMELDAPVVVDAPWWEIQSVAEAQESMRLRLKEATGALENVNAALETKVAERTSELRRSQAALQEREVVFRAIFENAAIGISSLTPELTCQRVNRAYCEFTGYSEEELLAGTGLDLIASEDRDRVRAGYEQLAIGQARSFRIETGMVHRDGRLLWADIQVTAIRQGNGRVVSLLSTILDVTDQRNMENELERQFALVKALLDTIPNPIFYKGADTRFLGCNKAYEEAFGTSLHHFVGKRVLDLTYLPEADRMAYQAEDERVIVETGRVAREMQMLLADGELHDVLYSVTGFANRDGTPGGLVGVIVDITPLKTAEREAQRARSAAEAAAAAKADFLANMSHEIRTPMNAIIGLTHIALQTELTSRQRGYLEKVDAASKSLLGIINDILDYSKIEAGMMSIEQIDFRLDEVLSHVVDLCAHKADEKHLRLRSEIAAQVPIRLEGDPLRLQQILMNLVGNALKFTDQGEVVISVHASTSGMDRVQLRFEVRDSGIGMTEEQRARLFLPFTQADTSTTRRYGGTGLGLSICKRLVELMGGEIGVRSTLGQGSCFHFEIPFKPGSSTAPASPLFSEQRDILPDILRGKHVMLVEDNDINRDMAVEILEAAGIVVNTAANGAEAVELARRKGYDAILMDCHMPVMDGFEATRRILAGTLNGGTPILAMTASVLSNERDLCLAAGMCDHVAKPVDVADLYAKLAARIGGSLVPAAVHAVHPAVTAAKAATLDRAGAIKRMGGNEDLYRRLLVRFRDDQSDVVARMRTSLASGESDTARRDAHTLKGLAGNIGATALMSAAAAVESCLAAGECGSARDEKLANVETELLVVLSEIADGTTAEQKAAVPGEARGRDGAIRVRLIELRRLLLADDADAVRQLEELRPLLGHCVPDEALDRLARAVGRYQFETGVQLLDEILAGMDVGSNNVGQHEGDIA